MVQYLGAREEFHAKTQSLCKDAKLMQRRKVYAKTRRSRRDAEKTLLLCALA